MSQRDEVVYWGTKNSATGNNWNNIRLQTWKKPFICQLWNFGSTDLAGKKRVNYNKFNMATKEQNQILNPNAFFLPFERCHMMLQRYLHTIYIFCIINRPGVAGAVL